LLFSRVVASRLDLVEHLDRRVANKEGDRSSGEVHVLLDPPKAVVADSEDTSHLPVGTRTLDGLLERCKEQPAALGRALARSESDFLDGQANFLTDVLAPRGIAEQVADGHLDLTTDTARM